ncbi:MAG: hypothetical protein VX265_02980 [Myxococcota bacterium]|nr:hypothetical protein [Myxococcota bacterium]
MAPLPPRLLPLAALWLFACSTTEVVTLGTCDVALFAPDVDAARPGDPVTLGGTPLTTDWDTVVYVGGVEAEVTALDRVGCETCDACRVESLCTECGDCDDCDRVCAEQCDEFLTFLVPEVAPGIVDVWLINRHGRSDALPLTVLESDPTDSAQGSARR